MVLGDEGRGHERTARIEPGSRVHCRGDRPGPPADEELVAPGATAGVAALQSSTRPLGPGDERRLHLGLRREDERPAEHLDVETGDGAPVDGLVALAEGLAQPFGGVAPPRDHRVREPYPYLVALARVAHVRLGLLPGPCARGTCLDHRCRLGAHVADHVANDPRVKVREAHVAAPHHLVRDRSQEEADR